MPSYATPDLTIIMQLRDAGPLQAKPHINMKYEVNLSRGYRYIEAGVGDDIAPSRRGLSAEECEKIRLLAGEIRFPTPRESNVQMMDGGTWELKIRFGGVEITANANDEWPSNWSEVRVLQEYLFTLTGR